MSGTMMLAAVMLVALTLIYTTGTTVDLRHGEHWNLGAAGVEVFGALIGWPPPLTAVTVFAPVPTALASSLVFAAMVLNVARWIAVFGRRRSRV